MLMLSISTSGPIASAALIIDGAVAACEQGDSDRTHSETIMPLCEKLLAARGLSPGSIDAFGVDVGPGSFTGVRIGVCAANAMASALNRPVVAVSSLEALIRDMDEACALLDCRNGNGYAMVRSRELNMLPSAVVITELLEKLPENMLFAGDGAQLHRELILSRLPHSRFSEENCVTARAAGLAAWRKFIGGEISIEAMPLYLRPSQAERLAKEKR